MSGRETFICIAYINSESASAEVAPGSLALVPPWKRLLKQ